MKNIINLVFFLAIILLCSSTNHHENNIATNVNYRYNVPLIPQPTGVSCWAASIGMVVAYRDFNPGFDPQTVAADLGYWCQFFGCDPSDAACQRACADNPGGLNPNDRFPFPRYGMTVEEPLCYTVEGFVNLVRDNGPLWIAGNACYPDISCAHARVVTGVTGDGTTADGTIVHINDPDDGSGSYPNPGAQYTLTYTQLAAQMEDLGATEIDIPGAYYIAY